MLFRSTDATDSMMFGCTAEVANVSGNTNTSSKVGYTESFAIVEG